jgi:hypothetical protein
MISGVSRYILKVFLLVVLLGGIPGLLHADPFNLTGNWSYLESGGDVEDSWQFNQSYSLSGSKSLAASSDLSASFRYTKSSRQEGEDAVVMSPSATLGIRNDLFSLNLSATQTQRQTGSGPELTSRTWDVTGFSLLEKLPRLRLNYGQSTSTDDQNPRGQDTESDYFSASLDYSWSAFDLFYDYRTDTSTDNLVTSTTDSERHFAKIEYSDNFFQGKVGVNLSQQYLTSESETSSLVATGGTLFIPIGLSQTLTAQDDTPLFGALSPNGALNDGDTVTATTVEIAQAVSDQNLGMQTDFQQVNQLRVSLDQEIPLAIQSLLTWSLYTGADNLNWDLVSSSPPVSYEVEDSLTVVVVDVPGPALLERYVKLVVSSTGLSPVPVYVTELAAGNVVTATGNQVVASSQFVSHQSRVGMTYRPVDAWSFAYNMTLIKNEPDPGLANTQLNQVLSTSYVPTLGFSASASISENRDETESREDRRNRTYSLSAQKQLWETMNLSMGYSHSESYVDSTRNSETDSVNGFLNAQLFPDLSANLNLNWSRSENPQEDTESENYGWRLNSTARLTPRINANAYYDYSASKSEGVDADADADDDATRYGLGLNFRTSDILLFYASLSRNVDEKTTAFTGSASWRVTPKIQTSFSTSQALEQGDSESYSANVSWLVSSHLSLRSSADYHVADGDEVWSWRLNINATF